MIDCYNCFSLKEKRKDKDNFNLFVQLYESDPRLPLHVEIKLIDFAKTLITEDVGEHKLNASDFGANEQDKQSGGAAFRKARLDDEDGVLFGLTSLVSALKKAL